MSNKLIIKYHNVKMLLTLDMNTFFQIIEENFGSSFELKFEEMNEKEKESTTSLTDGLRKVNERFWIFSLDKEKEYRRKDLETEIISRGHK